MKQMHGRTRSILVGALASTTLAIAPAQATAQPATTWTTVRHDVTFTQSFPDPEEPDLCGRPPVASTETFRIRTELNHLTELADGSFHFTDFETGTIFIDYHDPAIQDASTQFTDTFQVNLTRGETVTVSGTFHQFGGGLKIWYRLHITEVAGTPTVEKEILKFTGCP